jgi:hypothetical protein
VQGNQQQSGDLKGKIATATGFAQSLALLLAAWLRIPGTCGSRYFSGHAFIGLCFLFVLTAFAESGPLMKFWIATGLWMLFHRLMHSWRVGKGYRCHSRYVGTSLLSAFCGNVTAITILEPLVTFITGIVLIQNGYGYGGFVVILSICLFISSGYLAMAEQAKITAIEDAKAEQEWLSEYTRR